MPNLDVSKGESIAFSAITNNVKAGTLSADFFYRNTSGWGEVFDTISVSSSTNERIAIA